MYFSALKVHVEDVNLDINILTMVPRMVVKKLNQYMEVIVRDMEQFAKNSTNSSVSMDVAAVTGPSIILMKNLVLVKIVVTMASIVFG